LIAGAKMLGTLWKEGVRCPSNWAACSCPEPTKFCRAKALWVRLAKDGVRDIPPSPFGIVEAMTDEELREADLTVIFEIPGIGKAVVGGSKGQISFEKLLELASDREGLRRVLTTLTAFPGSKVE
jgi:hypothetical protein